MINHLPPAPRLGREHWDRVHRAGDKHPPITLPEEHHPFWAPEWELKRDRRRTPRWLLRAASAATLIAGVAFWAGVIWMLGGRG